uniref:Uncharacterized protein n=1 Tax=Panagrolaimus sp. ES5 TaxID=591445 RepID=A0AC34F1R5_9BILA
MSSKPSISLDKANLSSIDSLEIPPELCTFDQEITVGPFKRKVTCECLIPFEDPLDVQVIHCFDDVMRREKLPYPFFETLKQRLRKWLLSEIDRLEIKTVEECQKVEQVDWKQNILDFRAMMNELKFVNDERNEKEMTFDEKFRFVMENADSDKLQMIVAKEAKMSEERISLIRARDFEVDRLTKACEAAVNESLEKREELEQTSYNLTVINEKLKQVNTNYDLQLKALSERQRQEYRDMITVMFETDTVPEYIRSESPPACVIRKITTEAATPRPPAPSMRDESFTIHIGTQVKTTHNIRIMQVNSLVEKLPAFNDDPNPEHDFSQRLYTLMNLYGSDLSAVVLLVDRDPLFHIHNRTQFFRICERTTELHFDDIEVQLNSTTNQTLQMNKARKNELPESTSYDIPSSCSKFDEQLCEVGDLMVTKHSNLNNAHVVFHLVVDKTLESDEITSRNAIMLGVRKIFQAASMYTIRNITFPLLLVENTTENMTVQWCLRRTDLVFKCIKGFMMEFCSNMARTSVLFPGSKESIQANYTINFVLPAKLSQNVFNQIVEQFLQIYNVRVTKMEGSLSDRNEIEKKKESKLFRKSFRK